jgi:uncharacterized protein (DUF4415 family)
MSRKRKQPTIDHENPEWTKEDFARARPLGEVLPSEALKNFKQHRGPQKTPRKVPVSIRLSPVVVAHFKATGPGWQARIDDALLRIAKRDASRRKGNAA